MSFTHYEGPLVVFGRARSAGGLGQTQDYNPDSPSPGLIGEYMSALLDTRVPFTYQPGQGASQPFYGYLGGQITLIDQVPFTINDAAIAALQAPTAATPLTLNSGALPDGITTASVKNALTGAMVTGLLAIDASMATVQPSSSGTSGSLNLWSPATSISRALSLTSGANLSGGTYTARGYDIYGYPVTCTRAGPNANTVNFSKALKYVESVTPSASSVSTVSVGTSDIYGLPLRADAFGYLTIFWNNTLITAATGFVAAVITDPATATTGDVRGTYATQDASDATKALQVFWRPKAANISQTGLWGIAQV